MTESNDLTRIVDTNRNIQRVVEVASSLEVVAFNASVLSLRAGSSARGFGVASSELRRFSNSLDHEMKKLRVATVAASVNVSRLIQADRHLRMFDLAHKLAPKSKTIDDVRAKRRAAAEQIAAALSEDEKRIDSRLREVKLFAQIGWALSRTARIEAASANSDNEALSGVAEQFATAMESVLGDLSRLSV